MKRIVFWAMIVFVAEGAALVAPVILGPKAALMIYQMGIITALLAVLLVMASWLQYEHEQHKKI